MCALLSQPTSEPAAPQPSLSMPPLTPDVALTPGVSEPRQDKAFYSATHQGFTWHETLVGMTSILFWIGLIDFGYLVNSNTYRQQLASMQGHSLGYVAGNLIMVLLSYTVSNVALLCCLCGFLGAMADRSDIDGAAHARGDWDNLSQKYASAILRGFFVFLVLMSGMILVSGTDLSVTTPQTYGHLAGTASLFSFLLGWDAHLFTKFVQKVYEKGVSEVQQTDAAAQQKMDKHSLLTAPDGTTREEVAHIETSGSISSASLSNSPPATAPGFTPSDNGNGKSS